MSRDDAYLLDILEAATLALSYVSCKTQEDFRLDIQCQDAVIRRLEIMGEAARRVSSETRERLRELPWGAMIGMRNVLIHEYDAVDFAIVWHSLHHDLPPVIELLRGCVQPRASN